jgi:hypothetical protein
VSWTAWVHGTERIRVQGASFSATRRRRSVSDSANDELVESDYDADRHEANQQNEPDRGLLPNLDACRIDNPHGDPDSTSKPREHEQDRSPAQQPFADPFPHGRMVAGVQPSACAHRHGRSESRQISAFRLRPWDDHAMTVEWPGMSTARVVAEDGLYLVVAQDADLTEVLEEADLGASGLAIEVHAEVLFISTIDPDQEFIDLEIRRFADAPEELLDELATEWGLWTFGQIRAESPIEVQTLERVPMCQVTDRAGDYEVALFGRTGQVGAESHLMLVWPEPGA